MLREFGLNEALYLVYAAQWTVALTAIAFAGGGLLGLLFLVLRVVPARTANWLAIGYIQAIHRSQIEAGLSLGLSRLQVFRYVVLFPALKVIYPALASQFILLMLATSIVSQISAQELFHAAGFVESRTFRSFEIYLVVIGMYLVMALMFRVLFSGIYYFVFHRR